LPRKDAARGSANIQKGGEPLLNSAESQTEEVEPQPLCAFHGDNLSVVPADFDSFASLEKENKAVGTVLDEIEEETVGPDCRLDFKVFVQKNRWNRRLKMSRVVHEVNQRPQNPMNAAFLQQN
jgi:hypothetical protein